MQGLGVDLGRAMSQTGAGRENFGYAPAMGGQAEPYKQIMTPAEAQSYYGMSGQRPANYQASQQPGANYRPSATGGQLNYYPNQYQQQQQRAQQFSQMSQTPRGQSFYGMSNPYARSGDTSYLQGGAYGRNVGGPQMQNPYANGPAGPVSTFGSQQFPGGSQRGAPTSPDQQQAYAQYLQQVQAAGNYHAAPETRPRSR